MITIKTPFWPSKGYNNHNHYIYLYDSRQQINSPTKEQIYKYTKKIKATRNTKETNASSSTISSPNASALITASCCPLK